MESSADDDSSADDREELENLLYSQLHYTEDTESLGLTPTRLQECTAADSPSPQQLLSRVPHQHCDNEETSALDKPVDHVKEDYKKKAVSETVNNDKGGSRLKRTRQVINPLYQSSDEESSDDEGIIVVSDSDTRPPKVITLSSDSDSDQRRTHSNRKKQKSDFYVAEFESDLEEDHHNISTTAAEISDSDGSIEVLDDGMQLNISQGRELSLSEAIQLDEDIVEETPKKWNNDMRKYYCSYKKENLSDTILVPKHASSCDWAIDRADLFKDATTKSRYFAQKARCNNCNQMGHYARDCKEPRKKIRCAMCGSEGHKEVRCPANCCLGCGQPGLGFRASCSHCRYISNLQCKECGFYGHLGRDCPDHWRRYHQTVVHKKTPSKPQASLKQSHQFWCCNCGRKGHLIDECRRYLYSSYPIAPLRVIKYTQQSNSSGDLADETETNFAEMIADPKTYCARKQSPAMARHDMAAGQNRLPGKQKHNLSRRDKKNRLKQRLEAETAVRANANSARQMAFINRINKGINKKDKKREKFYNTVLSAMKNGPAPKKKGAKYQNRNENHFHNKPTNSWNNNKPKSNSRKRSKKHLDLNVMKQMKF